MAALVNWVYGGETKYSEYCSTPGTIYYNKNYYSGSFTLTEAMVSTNSTYNVQLSYDPPATATLDVINGYVEGANGKYESTNTIEGYGTADLLIAGGDPAYSVYGITDNYTDWYVGTSYEIRVTAATGWVFDGVISKRNDGEK